MKRVQFPQDYFVHKHGRRFIVLYTNMVAVTSCKKDLLFSVKRVEVKVLPLGVTICQFAPQNLPIIHQRQVRQIKFFNASKIAYQPWLGNVVLSDTNKGNKSSWRHNTLLTRRKFSRNAEATKASPTAIALIPKIFGVVLLTYPRFSEVVFLTRFS